MWCVGLLQLLSLRLGLCLGLGVGVCACGGFGVVRWVVLLGCVFLLSAAASSGRLLQLWCAELLQLLCLCLGLRLGLGLGVCVSVLGSYVRAVWELFVRQWL
jgi:hypothetical protein